MLIALFVFAGLQPADAKEQTAILAGGCFWCLEHDLEHLPGVIEAVSGYSGGHVDQPTYRQVSAENTGHQEAVQVRFDSVLISYSTLLRSFWRNVDPFDSGGQFCDRGDSYRPVIFVADATQARDARTSAQAAADELGYPRSAIEVEIREAVPFWPAEQYHQNYAMRSTIKYNYYRFACGRDRRLDQVWGDNARTGNDWVNKH
ncbi:peptide-methionine (S)-S-oxide reductase MsrA [Synechococcus sp. M16CYN]|uniref:peptide-methionine (S)-S-oxide reductase MsrA n=1 Tax=Synechococcus sp. M16CYN TaxID=3103139 RepID=UPI00333FB40B